MKRFLTMYKIEQRIYFRSSDVILFGLLMLKPGIVIIN